MLPVDQLPPALAGEPAEGDAASVARGAGIWALAWRRFLRHRLALGASVVLLLLVLSALAAPWIAPYNPNQGDFAAFDGPPSSAHLLGTDSKGYDVLSRLLYGGRISLLIGTASMIAAIGVGTAVGAVAGYFGGWIDAVLMRLTDVVLAFPLYLLLFVVSAFFAGSSGDASIALIVALLLLVSWTTVGAAGARPVPLSLKEREFVQASRAVGAGPLAIIVRQLLPNAVAPILVNATLLVGNNIILESVLSFFGFGVQPPTSSWGTMLADGRAAQAYAPMGDDLSRPGDPAHGAQHQPGRGRAARRPGPDERGRAGAPVAGRGGSGDPRPATDVKNGCGGRGS